MITALHDVDSIELCSDMDAGGLTPSAQMIRIARDILGHYNGLMVMMRPRPGNFVYTNKEVDNLIEQIEIAADNGADGIVFGCLDDNMNINTDQLNRITAVADKHYMDTTFHMAFDCISNKNNAIRVLKDCEIDRILTAGQPWGITIPWNERILNLSKTIELTDDKIEIVIGCGINEEKINLIGQNLNYDFLAVHAYSSTLLQGKPDNEKIKKMIQTAHSFRV